MISAGLSAQESGAYGWKRAQIHHYQLCRTSVLQVDANLKLAINPRMTFPEDTISAQSPESVVNRARDVSNILAEFCEWMAVSPMCPRRRKPKISSIPYLELESQEVVPRLR